MASVLSMTGLAMGAGNGLILLHVGSDWCESGEHVRKVFESQTFRRMVRHGGFKMAVYDDMENPTPKVQTANAKLRDLRVEAKRFPAITFVSPAPHRYFAQIDNIPFDITAQELAGKVEAALSARKDAETLFRTGARLRKSDPKGAADAYGRAFEILSAQTGVLNEQRLFKGNFAYKDEWQELMNLDGSDRYGWKMRFEAGYGFDIVARANKFREVGHISDGKGYIDSLRKIPTEHLTTVQRQCIEMAEYALVKHEESQERIKTLLKRAFDLGRDTVWGQCAMGFLIMSGEDIKQHEPYRAKVRPRPEREKQKLSISANSLKTRLSQIKAKDELNEAQKTDIARYAMLRRIRLNSWNDLADRPGARPFMDAFIKDRHWMEDFAWSGPCDPYAIFALESLIYQDNGRWIAGDGPGRRFATAVALEHPYGREEWLADFLDAYRETALAKRQHKQALEQPVWQWRYAVAMLGSQDVDDPPNQQRFIDKFYNVKLSKMGDAHGSVPYRKYNCFGENIHTHAYYEPWVTAGEWPRRRYSYLVGGVCGELSTFASICSSAHGLPAIPCGQPSHCAYTRRRPDGSWRINNYIAPPTTIREFWPQGGRWTYLLANEGTFEGDREKRHDADRFSELAHFAERRKLPAEEVAAFHKRACRAWRTHYGAWRAYGEWLNRANRPIEEHHEFALAAADALKGMRQPLWDLLTPYFEHVMEKGGAPALANSIVKIAPALRQSDDRIQEEGDLKSALAKWTEPLANNDALMETVTMAVLSAQAGTRDYFAHALAWCGDFLTGDKKRLDKMLAIAAKATAKTSSRKKTDAPTKSFLVPLILSAASTGNIPVFKKLSALQDKIGRYKPPAGKRHLLRDFGMDLISVEGLLKTSSSAGDADTPELHAHALDIIPHTGRTFLTKKEKEPWAAVQLPWTAIVKGIVIVNAGQDEKVLAKQTPIEVELSEDGQNWQKVFSDKTARDKYRIDMTSNKTRSVFVRVRRTPNDKVEEEFQLAKILVYGKKLR